jgi:hypothetical protein
MAVLLVLLPQPFLSCGVETAGETIRFHTAVLGTTEQGQSPTRFDSTKGWSVTLTSAHAVFGPVYFYGGAPMAQAGPLTRFFGGVAKACPTHAQYDYGAVLGEVLEQHVVDLLASEPTSTGEVQGEAGTCQSAELHLHPPGNQGLATGSTQVELDKLEGHTVVIEGTASKDSTTVPFRAALDIPDEGTMRIVQNIAGSVELDDVTQRPGSILVEILLDAWLDQVDFSSLTETDATGNYLFSEATQARAALLQAIRNRYSYRIEWREP